MPLNRRKFFAAVTGLAVMPKVAMLKPVKVSAMSIPIAPICRYDAARLHPAAVRDIVLPEITAALEAGVCGYREKWKALLAPPETLEALRKKSIETESAGDSKAL